jgi:hypothetical protein
MIIEIYHQMVNYFHLPAFYIQKVMAQTKTIASDELLMEQLNNRDWNRLWLRLLWRCAWVLRNRYGVKWPNAELHSYSRSIIIEVTDKIFLEKVRNWNLDEYPDFEDFIVGVVDSHINNNLKKKKKETNVDDIEHVIENNGNVEASVFEKISTDELRNQIYNELLAAGADDDELLIFECLADGIEKPEAIKKELGLDDVFFHNIWRKFKRKRIIIQKKLAAHGY